MPIYNILQDKTDCESVSNVKISVLPLPHNGQVNMPIGPFSESLVNVLCRKEYKK